MKKETAANYGLDWKERMREGGGEEMESADCSRVFLAEERLKKKMWSREEELPEKGDEKKNYVVRLFRQDINLFLVLRQNKSFFTSFSYHSLSLFFFISLSFPSPPSIQRKKFFSSSSFSLVTFDELANLIWSTTSPANLSFSCTFDFSHLFSHQFLTVSLSLSLFFRQLWRPEGARVGFFLLPAAKPTGRGT